MEIVKSIWDSTKWYLLTVLVTVVIFANCKGCSHDPKVATTNHDTIYQQEQVSNEVIKQTLEELHVLKLKNDSLMLLKPRYVIRYKTKFDSLYITDTSCQSSLIMLYNSFGDLNDLNDSIISNSSKRLVNDSILIANLNHKIELKQSHITIDSTRLVALIDTLPNVKRKGYWKGFKFGFLTGAILVEGVNIGGKFIKP